MKCYTTSEILLCLVFLFNSPVFSLANTEDELAKRILLHDYNQSDSVTRCETSLIQHRDNWFIRGLASFVEEKDSLLSSIGIELRKKNGISFELLGYIYTDQGCNGYVGLPLYCENTTTDGIFRFFVNHTAETQHSNAMVRAKLTFRNNTQIYSNDIELPGIYDPAVSTKTKIVINNQQVEPGPESCFVTIYRSQLTADYSCDSPYSPCWLEVAMNDSVQPPQRNKSHLHFEAGHYVHNYSILMFRQAVCQFGQHETTLQCIILKEIHHDGTKNLAYVGFFFAAFIPLTVGIILCCIALRTGCWRRNGCLIACCAKLFHWDIRPQSSQYQDKLWGETTPFGECQEDM